MIPGVELCRHAVAVLIGELTNSREQGKRFQVLLEVSLEVNCWRLREGFRPMWIDLFPLQLHSLQLL